MTTLYYAVIGPRPDPYPELLLRVPAPAPGPFPSPRVLVLEIAKDGCLVHGFAADGRSCGDNWYPSESDAKSELREDYGPNLGEWCQSEADQLREVAEAGLRYARGIGV
jgi:hypothetical protein